MLKLSKSEKIKVLIWVEALRSGVFPQTRAVMHDSEGYCCLGVACELFVPDAEKIITSEGFLEGVLPFDSYNCPKWLVDINDDVLERTSDSSLSKLNDNYTSFKDIADLIEKLYLK